MPTIGEQLAALVAQKNSLAANLNTMGVTASESETLNTLVPKVLDISGGGGGINAFGLFSLTTRYENSMSWQKTLSSLKAVWNDYQYIGADAFIGLNTTDVSSISVDVATGSSYSDSIDRWYVYLALMDTDPSTISYPANQYQTYFKVYDEFHTRNSSTTLTIDVSNYTGLNYLILSAIGWNAEFTNLAIS